MIINNNLPIYVMGNLIQKTKRNISIHPERHQDKICIECDESYVYVKSFFEPPPTSRIYKYVNGRKNTCYYCCQKLYVAENLDSLYIQGDHL